MAKMKNYTDPNPDTGRTQLAETPFGSSQRLAEYLRANAQPNEFRITTGAPALSIEATDEAYAAALDAYERDTGTGKYAAKAVSLREPRPPANTDTDADAQAVNAAIPEYDTLTAEQIIDQASSLSAENRAAALRHETANKNRKSVVAALSPTE
jgi:hypothetical protein